MSQGGRQPLGLRIRSSTDSRRPFAPTASSLAPTASDDALNPAPAFDFRVSDASDELLPVCVMGFLARRTPPFPGPVVPDSPLPHPRLTLDTAAGSRSIARGKLSRPNQVLLGASRGLNSSPIENQNCYAAVTSAISLRGRCPESPGNVQRHGPREPNRFFAG